jgi:transcriptional regulator with XRE-family HTH domain
MHLKGGDFMTVADRIKQARLEKGLTQEELAKKCGYANKGNVCRLEHAENNISARQVQRIAEQLGVSAAYLMGWTAETKPIETDAQMTDDEKTLLNFYRTIAAEDKPNILQYAQFLSKRG